MSSDLDRVMAAASEMDGWHGKAVGNVRKWALQDIVTLLVATQEELGEVAEEILEGLDQDRPMNSDTYTMLHGVESIVYAGEECREMHQFVWEDDEGRPLDPDIDYEIDDSVLDDLEEELSDTAALLVQVQAAIERLREEG